MRITACALLGEVLGDLWPKCVACKQAMLYVFRQKNFSFVPCEEHRWSKGPRPKLQGLDALVEKGKVFLLSCSANAQSNFFSHNFDNTQLYFQKICCGTFHKL